jgi:hypothetical protein
MLMLPIFLALASFQVPPPVGSGDWLIGTAPVKASVAVKPDSIRISNGLVSQLFQLQPNAATVSIENLMTGESMLRAVGPEATIEVDGTKMAVGGLQGQPDRAFLFDSWRPSLTPIPGSLAYKRYEIVNIDESMPWVHARHSADASWPPKGVAIKFVYEGAGLEANIEYEIYSGLPVISKRLTVVNHRAASIRLNGFETEDLSLVEAESDPDSKDWKKPAISVLTDYNFSGMASRPDWQAVRWETDPAYTTQVNYDLQTPCRLVVKAPVGPDMDIPPGQKLDSFRTYILFHDSTDRERQGLGVRKLFRMAAPWCTENPIMLHLTSTDPVVVKRAIDQATDVGFEMVIFSFGSGLNMEDVSTENIRRFSHWAEYAHSKGLQIGGYSLLASRSIDPETDVIDPKTGKPGGAVFGSAPCLGSQWGRDYFSHLKTFLSRTGFDLLEHDGSYAGDVCASTTHPGHRGLSDSQWTQYQTIAEFYRWCRARGIYLNVPDDYFLAGSNKTGMGYREDNWSLPREQQHIHARQNLFDGTWEKTPTMGWMFTPLVEYHGGGAAATLEPLKDHLPDYALHLMNNFGYGAQSCYRGPRLYDAESTRAVVKKWVGWFLAHRSILESDVIHVSRADGQHLDAVLHVNPVLLTKAMAVVYNPLPTPLQQRVVLPLYYSGLSGTVVIRIGDGRPQTLQLDEARRFIFSPTVPPKSCVWVTFQKP